MPSRTIAVNPTCTSYSYINTIDGIYGQFITIESPISPVIEGLFDTPI